MCSHRSSAAWRRPGNIFVTDGYEAFNIYVISREDVCRPFVLRTVDLASL